MKLSGGWAAFAVLAGQAASAQPATFDAASVKPAAGERPQGGYNHQLTPLGVTMRHVSLGYAIRLAYGISRPYELSGPSWLDPPTGQEYDIAAKVSAAASPEQIRSMLRALLAERFHLAAHREKRSLPAYTLHVVRGAAALRRSGGEQATNIRSGKAYDLICTNVSMAQLALQLGPPLTSRPVVDRTGLAGGYDFTLDLAPYILDPETGAPVTDAKGLIDTETAALRAVREQLGLLLRRDRAPLEVLVVDHVEKTPSAN
jgi:uncharacterized protein (TIGR03435 family)